MPGEPLPPDPDELLPPPELLEELLELPELELEVPAELLEELLLPELLLEPLAPPELLDELLELPAPELEVPPELLEEPLLPELPPELLAPPEELLVAPELEPPELVEPLEEPPELLESWGPFEGAAALVPAEPPPEQAAIVIMANDAKQARNVFFIASPCATCGSERVVPTGWIVRLPRTSLIRRSFVESMHCKNAGLTSSIGYPRIRTDVTVGKRQD